jgi:hypothetical protein
MAVVSNRTPNAISCHMSNIGRITDLRYCGFYLYQSSNFRLADSIRVLQGDDRLQYKHDMKPTTLDDRSGPFPAC